MHEERMKQTENVDPQVEEQQEYCEKRRNALFDDAVASNDSRDVLSFIQLVRIRKSYVSSENRKCENSYQEKIQLSFLETLWSDINISLTYP